MNKRSLKVWTFFNLFGTYKKVSNVCLLYTTNMHSNHIALVSYMQLLFDVGVIFFGELNNREKEYQDCQIFNHLDERTNI